MWLARGNTSRQHREIGLYKVTLDPKLPKYIQILDIFGSAKIQPDVVQPPGSQKITFGDAGAVDRVEFSGGTRADRLHDLVRDRCARCIYNSGRHWEEAEVPAAQAEGGPRGALPPLLLRLQAHDEVWHHVQAYV